MESADHEVAEGTPGAHSHDHTHTESAVGKETGRHATHMHWHRHLEDREADAGLNGHIHPLRPRRLPWETNED
jgi:hypothetical protein